MLWSYWNDGIAVRNDSRTLETVLNSTIGTDGFHCLAAVLDGKLRHLPTKARQRAKMHVWSQVHKAFSVVSAEDIPATQLDSARNFIAAYNVHEGEFLGKEPHGTQLTDHQLYAVYCVNHYFGQLNDIFHRYKLHTHLTGLGSRAGVEMIDRFSEGMSAVNQLKTLAPEFDAVQQRLRVNQYERSDQ